MRKVFYSSQFKRDFKLIIKRGYKIERIRVVMDTLEQGELLDPKYKEHFLSGNYNGFLECHIEPDWLLIYKINGQDLYFARTGTHADLFNV